jgi:hypothetical protein
MTAELRPCAALTLSPARSRQLGKKELDDHSGPDTDALGPRSGKAGSGQPGPKSEMPTNRSCGFTTLARLPD